MVMPRYLTVFDHFSDVLFRTSWLMLLFRDLRFKSTATDLAVLSLSRQVLRLDASQICFWTRITAKTDVV